GPSAPTRTTSSTTTGSTEAATSPPGSSQSCSRRSCERRSGRCADRGPAVLRHRNEFPVEGELPGFPGATAWLNTAPLTPADLRGRVVLVSFGTYTCINWI